MKQQGLFYKANSFKSRYTTKASTILVLFSNYTSLHTKASLINIIKQLNTKFIDYELDCLFLKNNIHNDFNIWLSQKKPSEYYNKKIYIWPIQFLCYNFSKIQIERFIQQNQQKHNLYLIPEVSYSQKLYEILLVDLQKYLKNV